MKMEKNAKKSIGIRILVILAGILVLFAVIVALYILSLQIMYQRIPDETEQEIHESDTAYAEPVAVGKTLSIISYNIGFGAYHPDYSFFMDGGKSSWADSPEQVFLDVWGAASLLKEYAPEFVFLQEVDEDATRSYHLDEVKLMADLLPDYSYVFTQNWDTPFILYPLKQPHGHVKTGMSTYSKYPIASALRRSFPVPGGMGKFFDLDRCYTIHRIPTENGKELVLIHLHMSAYSDSQKVRDGQENMIAEEMRKEYAAGNYVIVGGDFNHDLLSDAAEQGKVNSWAHAYNRDLLPEHFSFGFDLLPEQEREALCESCRNADAPYDPDKAFVLTVDGFILSDNVKLEHYENVDAGYQYSDHNPVWMQFELMEP